MANPDKQDNNLIKIDEFIREHIHNLKNQLSKLNERYEPVKYVKERPLLLIAIIIASVIVLAYPLLSVWFLACLGTGYPGYRIIKSMIADRDEINKMNVRQKQISEFMQKSVLDQKIIQIPIRHNSRIIQRAVIIKGELEDGISVKDPETGIQSKYMWSNIDLNFFYINYVQPSLSE